MRKVSKIGFNVLIIIVIYNLLKFAVAPFVANLFLFVVILWGLKYIVIKSKIRFLSETIINDIPQQLKINNNVLINSHCIVKYFPKEKIVVIDRPKPKFNYGLRSFVIDNNNFKDVVRCWGEICTIFGELTYLDTLYSYFEEFSGKLNIKFIDLNSDDPIIQDMSEFFNELGKTNHDTVVKKETEKNTNKIKYNNKSTLVNFNDLIPREQMPAKKNSNNTGHLKELNSEKLIYVNYTDAQNISRLPGINLIRAKKIVAYRDINGLFRRKDDFIAVSGVKKHFVNKIKEMISLEKDPQVKNSKNKSDYERTVD